MCANPTSCLLIEAGHKQTAKSQNKQPSKKRQKRFRFFLWSPSPCPGIIGFPRPSIGVQRPSMGVPRVVLGLSSAPCAFNMPSFFLLKFSVQANPRMFEHSQYVRGYTRYGRGSIGYSYRQDLSSLQGLSDCQKDSKECFFRLFKGSWKKKGVYWVYPIFGSKVSSRFPEPLHNSYWVVKSQSLVGTTILPMRAIKIKPPGGALWSSFIEFHRCSKDPGRLGNSDIGRAISQQKKLRFFQLRCRDQNWDCKSTEMKLRSKLGDFAKLRGLRHNSMSSSHRLLRSLNFLTNRDPCKCRTAQAPAFAQILSSPNLWWVPTPHLQFLWDQISHHSWTITLIEDLQ